MKKALLGVAVILAIGAIGATAVAQDELASTVTIVNDSDWAIHYLYLSPTSDNEWGPDQLGDEVIAPNGGTFELHSIPCDTYDVKLVDEDGDECVVGAVDLCLDDDVWHITSAKLLACQSETE